MNSSLFPTEAFNKKTCIDTLLTDFFGWSIKEYLWLFIAVASIAATSLLMGGGMIEFVSSVTGIIGAILIAKAKTSAYVWALVATALYAYIAYMYQLFGEAILYTLLFTPMQVLGYYLGMKNSTVKSSSVDIVKRHLSNAQRFKLAGYTIVAIIVYAALLRLLKGSFPGLDAATAVLSVVATILMVKRYAEQWVVWILVNIVAVILWVTAVMHHETQGWAVLAMWVTYLLNSVYGWWQWRVQYVEAN